MYNPIQITEICSYSSTILFTSTADEISKIRLSVVDTQASLLSELSMINNDIQREIEFNCNLISTEYIDYLKAEILKINSITMSEDTAPDLTSYASRIMNASNTGSLMSEKMLFMQSKISQIINHDIAKSVALRPVSESKTSDFIMSVKDRIKSISDICTDIWNKIQECEYLVEACDFSKYYLEEIIPGCVGIPPLLEEEYNTIITGLSAEYSKWKEVV